jgi:hypothetical protein
MVSFLQILSGGHKGSQITDFQLVTESLVPWRCGPRVTALDGSAEEIDVRKEIMLCFASCWLAIERPCRWTRYGILHGLVCCLKI